MWSIEIIAVLVVHSSTASIINRQMFRIKSFQRGSILHSMCLLKPSGGMTKTVHSQCIKRHGVLSEYLSEVKQIAARPRYTPKYNQYQA